MRARVPHGLLTHVALNPLPVLRGEQAKAVYRRLLDMELRPFYAGPVLRPKPGEVLWIVFWAPSGRQQWVALQPDEWLDALTSWCDGLTVASFDHRAARSPS